MVKHYWKVRMFPKDSNTPIDINVGTREIARIHKRRIKKYQTFINVKIFKVTPFMIPKPFRGQEVYQCEYFQEVR